MSSEALERAAQIRAALSPDGRDDLYADDLAALDALLAEVARLEQERDHHEHEAAEWRTALLSESSQRSQAAYDAMAAALAVAREREQRLAKTLARAAKVALNLMEMIDHDTWRSTGGDDGQGHYEGDYRAERLVAEITEWAALVDEPAAGPKAKSGDARDAVVWSEPRQDYTGRFYRDGLGTGTGAEADALLNATLAEPEQAQSRNTPPSDDSAADTAGEPGLLSSSPHPASASGSASAAADEPGETP